MVEILKMMLGRNSEDEILSRLLFELTLGSVVPLAMFGNWSVHSSRVMFCKSPVMFNVVFSLFSLRVDKSLRVPGLVSKKFRIIQLPSVKGLG